MRELILTLTAVFVAANVYVEWRNRATMPWWSNPLSAYLAGVPGARVQSVGYLLFAANIVLIAATNGRVVAAILLIAGAVALVNVVWTKWQALRDPIARAQVMREHVLSAGIAFITITAALLILAWRVDWVSFALALAAPVSAFLFWRFEPTQTALEEKAFLGFLLASLVVLIA